MSCLSVYLDVSVSCSAQVSEAGPTVEDSHAENASTLFLKSLCLKGVKGM